MSNPIETLNNRAMTKPQIIVIIIAVMLNALDGFDVLSISFAAPGIANEWNVDRAALGIVLSMELIGMCVGSIILGGIADKIGRKNTIIFCLIAMSVGMIMVTTSDSIVTLSLWRVITGFGIGGMLAAVNPMAAEFSNIKNRNLCVSLVVIGYPLGGILGGTVVVPLLQHHDWRSVFYFGAAATVLFIPIVLMYVPESVHWLAKKQPNNALARINQSLSLLKHELATKLPELTQQNKNVSPLDIFSKALIAPTIIVTTAYFFHITTFYFILKWSPKIVVDMGFAASSAAQVLTWANVGGALGGAIFGFLATKIDLRKLTFVVLLASSAAIIMFGQSPADLNTFIVLAAISGFMTNAGIVGLYSLFASAFPPQVRAFGTGFAIGVGRGGAVISPVIAGFLFDAGVSLSNVALVMAAGSLLAAVALVFLKIKNKQS